MPQTDWPTLLLAAEGLPPGLVDPVADAREQRFGVYRNNVMSSLVQALRDGFPVVRALVGEAFFSAMAPEFVRIFPPRSPVLTRYGTDFPSFLEAFPPVASLPYLADVARLELALRHAYHAADTRPIDPARLDTPDIGAARLRLAPALGVIRSPYPIYDIWRANTQADAPAPRAGGQCVLVTRPDWDPIAEPISPEEAQFYTNLTQYSLEDAVPEGLDLARALTRLMSRKSIIELEVNL